ncbi:hypothetical protein [uncultured Mitsuokella sp.]|nr:hypothetical protein [uncultured Mitsuokella sp.]
MHFYPEVSQKKLWKDECKRYGICLGAGILALLGLGGAAIVLSAFF